MRAGFQHRSPTQNPNERTTQSKRCAALGRFLPHMAIENDDELKETLDRVGGDLQAIQDYVERDFSRPCKIRFPRGFIRTAAHFRSRLAFVADVTLRQNLSYALMLHDVQHWTLIRTDLTGTAKEMLIKDAIVLLGNIAETLTKLPLSASAQKKSYKERTKRLESMTVITSALHADLDWLWDTRCNCHFFLVHMREYGHYEVADYNRAVRTLRAFRDALDAHFT